MRAGRHCKGLTFDLQLKLVRLLLHRALHTFNLHFCLPELAPQFSVLVNNALEVFRSLCAMLFEVLSHLLNFVLQRFSVFLRLLEVLPGFKETLVVILAHKEFILNSFELRLEPFGFDSL
jgi:hypothetical protein